MMWFLFVLGEHFNLGGNSSGIVKKYSFWPVMLEGLSMLSDVILLANSLLKLCLLRCLMLSRVIA